MTETPIRDAAAHQAAERVDQREGPDPGSLPDHRLPREPSKGMILVGWEGRIHR